MNEKSSSVRVRFAPSPTGYLHVGGARTALLNWLYARQHGGSFVLRIEDTDRERSSDEMTRAILDGMTWLGLDWDEGPYHQADGFDRHRADVAHLLDSGAAYRCFCSPEALEARRQAQPDAPATFRYDRCCLPLPAEESSRRAAAGEPHAVRFRVPDGRTAWSDAVHDEVAFENTDIEDFIILRTDGTPTYNMAVVSDDAAMRITHVLRGDDHLSNTPKQILLYTALGRPVPVFAHLPMILGPDGRRLSKRHGATAVGEYRAQGVLPDALLNFLALLGWSPGNDQEIFTRDELIRAFSLDRINRKSAIFDTQKLEWMNGRYLAAMPAADLVAALHDALGPVPDRPDAWWTELVELLKVRARTITEMAEQARPYVDDRVEYDEAAVAKHWKDPSAVIERLSLLEDRLGLLPAWDKDVLEAEVRRTAADLGIGAGKLIHPWRVALTGAAASPGIFDIAKLLGRERTLERVRTALAVLRDLA